MLWGIRSRATPFDFPIFLKDNSSFIDTVAYITPAMVPPLLYKLTEDTIR